MRKWMVIVDYNLSRVDDVRLLLKHGKEAHGLGSILIRRNPTQTDVSLADHVIDLSPLDVDFVEKAVAALKPFLGEISAVLPFSDDSVWSGAKLAETLGVAADQPDAAEAAFSKSVYRKWETELRRQLTAGGMMVPRFARIESLEDLASFARLCPFGFVLKPSCEGNNRGVLRLLPGDSLLEAFEEVESYLSGGLVAEELISFPEEYSFDGVGALNFITQKLSVNSRYPVEYGQIVPARLPKKVSDSVRFAGLSANKIVGQSFGPFHNEIKYSPSLNQSAVIEPNRRPAGMKIWHLAEKVFGVNLFKLWVDQALNPSRPLPSLKSKGIGAIRQLPSPIDGKLSERFSSEFSDGIFLRILSDVRSRGQIDISDIEWFDFRITKSSMDRCVSVPKDNGQFLGEISLFCSDQSIDVEKALSEFEVSWKSVISEFIEEESDENLNLASNSVS